MTVASSRLFRRAIRYGGLFVLALLVAMLAVGWWLWQATPTYYRPITFDSPAATERAARRAERFEYRTTAQLTGESVGRTERHFSIGERKVNEWLATRLQPWAANQNIDLPEGLVDPMVRFQPGRVLLTARLRLPDFNQVVTLVYKPVREQVSDAPVAMRLTRVVSGRLPLPTAWTVDRVLDAMALSDEQRSEWRERLHHLPLRFEMDGRTYAVRSVTITDERLTFQLSTVDEADSVAD